MPHLRHSGGIWQAHRPRRMLQGSLLVCRLQPQGLGCHGLLRPQAGRRQRGLVGLLLLLLLLLLLECMKLGLAAERPGPSSPLRMPGSQLLPLCCMLCSILAVHLPTQWGDWTPQRWAGAPRHKVLPAFYPSVMHLAVRHHAGQM